MAKDYTNLLPEMKREPEHENLLPGREPNQRRPFQGRQILKDIGSHIWGATYALPNMLQGIQHADESLGSTYDLIKQDPGLAAKIFGEEFLQTYGRMANAPSMATHYGEQRGVLPANWELPQLPGRVTGNEYREPVEGEGAIRGAAGMAAHGIPALFTGGTSLPYTMAAESVGAGEGPIVPFVGGKVLENLPKNIKGFSQKWTADEINKIWREGQKYFNKAYSAVFNAPGVPRVMQYRIPPSVERFFTKHFPTDSQNLQKFLQTRAPEDLNAALSDMKSLKRWITKNKPSEVANGIEAFNHLETLIPEMETHLESALEQGGKGTFKKYKKINEEYKKKMVPIDREMRDTLRAYEQQGLSGSFAHPEAVLNAAKGTEYGAFKQAYGKQLPGLKRAVDENYWANVMKFPFTDPLAMATGGALTGYSLAPHITRQFMEEE